MSKRVRGSSAKKESERGKKYRAAKGEARKASSQASLRRKTADKLSGDAKELSKTSSFYLSDARKRAKKKADKAEKTAASYEKRATALAKKAKKYDSPKRKKKVVSRGQMGRKKKK
jgi:hypothetical protein